MNYIYNFALCLLAFSLISIFSSNLFAANLCSFFFAEEGVVVPNSLYISSRAGVSRIGAIYKRTKASPRLVVINHFDMNMESLKSGDIIHEYQESRVVVGAFDEKSSYLRRVWVSENQIRKGSREQSDVDGNYTIISKNTDLVHGENGQNYDILSIRKWVRLYNKENNANWSEMDIVSDPQKKRALLHYYNKMNFSEGKKSIAGHLVLDSTYKPSLEVESVQFPTISEVKAALQVFAGKLVIAGKNTSHESFIEGSADGAKDFVDKYSQFVESEGVVNNILKHIFSGLDSGKFPQQFDFDYDAMGTPFFKKRISIRKVEEGYQINFDRNETNKDMASILNAKPVYSRRTTFELEIESESNVSLETNSLVEVNVVDAIRGVLSKTQAKRLYEELIGRSGEIGVTIDGVEISIIFEYYEPEVFLRPIGRDLHLFRLSKKDGLEGGVTLSVVARERNFSEEFTPHQQKVYKDFVTKIIDSLSKEP